MHKISAIFIHLLLLSNAKTTSGMSQLSFLSLEMPTKSIAIRPLADSDYTIYASSYADLLQSANRPLFPSPTYTDLLIAKLSPAPSVSSEAPKHITNNNTSYSPTSAPHHVSTMQSKLESSLAYNSAQHTRAHTIFLSKQLHYLAKLPGGLEVIKLREHMVTKEINYAIQMLRIASQSIVGKNGIEISNMAECWLELNNMTISIPEIDKAFKNVISELQMLTYSAETNSYAPVINLEKSQSVQKYVEKFEKFTRVWRENTVKFYEQCAFDTDNFYREHFPETFGHATSGFSALLAIENAKNPASWDFLKATAQQSFPDLTKKILNAEATHDLINITKMCKEGKLEQAYDIVKKHPSNDLR